MAMAPKRGGFLILYSDQVHVKRSFCLRVNTLWGIFRIIEPLFLNALQRKTSVRELRLWFQCIHRPRSQLPLFQDLTKGPSIALDRAVREIRKRFGQGAIRYGICAPPC
jgi:hypothetical protein